MSPDMPRFTTMQERRAELLAGDYIPAEAVLDQFVSVRQLRELGCWLMLMDESWVRRGSAAHLDWLRRDVASLEDFARHLSDRLDRANERLRAAREALDEVETATLDRARDGAAA